MKQQWECYRVLVVFQGGMQCNKDIYRRFGISEAAVGEECGVIRIGVDRTFSNGKKIIDE